MCYIYFHKASLFNEFERGRYLYYIQVGPDFLIIEGNNHLSTDLDVLLIRSFDNYFFLLSFILGM